MDVVKHDILKPTPGSVKGACIALGSFSLL